MNDFTTKLSKIEEKLDIYYDTDYESEKVEDQVNFAIKKELLSLILLAHNLYKGQKLEELDFSTFRHKAISLLLEHTGSYKDYYFMEYIFKTLVEREVITSSMVDEYTKSHNSRWR